MASGLLVMVLLDGGVASTQPRSSAVLVRRVVDGDTIDIAGLGRVGLLGVDAPELHGALDTSTAGGREAQQRLEGLLANRWVRLEYDPAGPARSAYVFLEDGRFVNEWLVQEGLARAATGRGQRRAAQLEVAESRARAARRGMWR